MYTCHCCLDLFNTSRMVTSALSVSKSLSINVNCFKYTNVYLVVENSYVRGILKSGLSFIVSVACRNLVRPPKPIPRYNGKIFMYFLNRIPVMLQISQYGSFRERIKILNNAQCQALTMWGSIRFDQFIQSEVRYCIIVKQHHFFYSTSS